MHSPVTAQEAAPTPFPPHVRAPDAAEESRLDAAWRQIGFHDASAFPANTIAAIAEIRPLVHETYGPDHPLALRLDTLEAASFARNGELEKAAALLAVNSASLDRRAGPEHVFAYAARELRANTLAQLARFPEAAALYEENAGLIAGQSGITAAERAKLGLGLAYLRRMQGRFAEAEALARAAVDAERVSGTSESLAFALAALGRSLTGLGRIAEAVSLIEEGLALHAGQDSARARLLFALAEAKAEGARPVDALMTFDEAAKLLLEVEGYFAPNTTQAVARKRSATIDLLGVSAAIVSGAMADGLPVPASVTQCPPALASLSDVDVAIAAAKGLSSGEERRDCLHKVRTFLEAGLGPDAPLTLEVRELLVAALDAIGDSEAALEEARTLTTARERVNGPAHPATGRALLLYSQTLASMGHIEHSARLETQAASLLPAEAHAATAKRLDTAGAHRAAQEEWAKAESAFAAGSGQSLRLAIEIVAGQAFNAIYRRRCTDAPSDAVMGLVSHPQYALIGNIRRPADEAHAIVLACAGKWDEAAKLYQQLTLESVSDAIAFQDANLTRMEARRALVFADNPKFYDTAMFAARNAAFYARERRYTPDRDADGKPLGYRRHAAAAGTDPLAVAFAATVAVNWAYDGHTVKLGGAEFTHQGINDAFQAGQDFAQSSAAASLLEAAARAAVTDPELTTLLDRQARLAAQIAAGSQMATTTSATEDDRQQLAALTDEIRRRFPAYANTARPFGLSIAQVRERLHSGEALLFIQPIGEDIYSFAVSAETSAWNRARITRAEMDELVERIRCRLDTLSCQLPLDGDHLFEGPAAAALYRELVAPVVHGFGDAQTIFAATGGSLGNIPLGLLVTGDAPMQSGDRDEELASLAQTRWLGDAYALAVLPSVSSLRAYGAAQAHSAAPSFIGIGDPVLGPPQESARGGASAKTANVRGGNGLADPSELKSLTSLPGTRRELTAIAGALGASPDQLLLAEDAREATVKGSSALASASIIAFATHAMLPGELATGAEPGLVLTPPDKPTGTDDGYLTATEAAALKLSATWVVLSACNTAGPSDGSSSESLSGLARAFFFAGAKSLLASHWPVLDDVGAAITTETFRIAAARPQVSRAEALRLALRGVRSGHSVLGESIPGWKPSWADPWAWAPFSLVETGT